MKPRKAPIVQYVCLSVLFLLAAGYQVRSVFYSFPDYFHQRLSSYPFVVNYANGKPHAQFVDEAGRRAGVRENDVLIAVNGRPLTGLGVFGEAIHDAKPGDLLLVRVVTGASQPRTATVLLEQAATPRVAWATATLLALKLVMPTFCILLGFWVVAVRPRDPSAWCLCMIMLFFSVLYSSAADSWGPVIRDVAVGYRAAVGNSWPIFMLLFGLYFPEPFPGKDPAWWKWFKRLLISALIAFCVLDVTVQVGQLESFASVALLSRIMDHLSRVHFILAFAGTGAFFACMGVKRSRAVTPDAKRRLRLLYAGSSVAMTPACVLFVTQGIKGGALEQTFPEWFVLFSLTLMLLFPITLAYVIVVHRAMDVRVVIRQGLQYALARGGIRILQILLTIAVVFSVVIFERTRKLSLPNEITTISLGMLAVIWLRKGGERLRKWTDRRFFRDAYNAEQILEALSEEVRSIVEKKPLLERVATKIAESLHIPRVAVLLQEGSLYRPAFALGYSGALDADLPESGGTIQRLKREAAPERVYLDDEDSWVNKSDSGLTDDERRKLASLAPQLLIPLAVKEKLLGIISLGQKRSEAPYSSTDIRLLKSVAMQTALALSNAELTSAIATEVAHREKLNREIEIAREVQERLFPQHLPEVAGLDYFGRCRTALAVGGDYYDFLALPEGKLGIALGDVSGKGIAAALTMASLQASLRSDAMRSGDDLGAMIARVNRMVYDASTEDRYATLFYAQFDPATRRLTYVNAGHCPPILLRNTANGRVTERLDQAGGTVVGLLPEFDYQQASVSLAPGDLLVIYTDGFSEAMSPDLEEWGDKRLLDAVASCDGLPAKDVITRVISAADHFASGAPQSDDMTLVVLRVL